VDRRKLLRYNILMTPTDNDVTVDDLLSELNRHALLTDRVATLESRIEESSRRYREAEEIRRIQSSLS
jgi:hypothetical protein